jgi:penicillin-binding protein 1A
VDGLLRKILIGVAATAAVLVLGLVGWVAFAVRDLPDYDQLAQYEPPITTRVHAGDGSLIAEFAREQRVFVPIEAIPDRVKNAFLSAEDKSFYEHSGIDYAGLMRATFANVLSIFTGDRLQGASTITQQVAKNMLLTSDRTVTRKVKEAFLAQRIEKAFSKDRILELYLNEIYLGQRAYGVAAAALNYFNKPLADLTDAEAAYLAALPKAPNNYNPVRQKERAVARRNWVLDRMVDNGFLEPEAAEEGKKEDLLTTDRLQGDDYVVSAHFVEELRREVLGLYGEKKLYDDGLSIRSTMDTRLQVAAAAALRKGLDQYDRRHGWRGPLDRFDLSNAASEKLAALGGEGAAPASGWGAIDEALAKRMAKMGDPPGASGWAKGLVLSAGAKGVNVAWAHPETDVLGRAALADEDVKWAAAGGKTNALQAGSLVYVQPLKSGRLALRQIPEIEGALVAMDPNTGRVLAMVGGYAFSQSQYNRATQAKRQPGSAFKPFVYAAALDFNTEPAITPATLVEDAPFQLRQADGTLWSPENYTREFYGATTLRQGLEKSRNLMTIRLAYEMGMDRVFQYGARLGVYDPETLPKCASAEACRGFLSYSLGSGETTLMRLAAAYATFINGGREVKPQLIDRVQDRTGSSIFVADKRCTGCQEAWGPGAAPPGLADPRPQILDPITAYQVSTMLEGAVQRGTATVVKTVNKPLAGKTGTTNDYKDAWFLGFSADLVVGVWAGFDKPKSLGEGETGGRLAAPIFGDFMKEALKDDPGSPFRAPRGVRFVQVDFATGALPALDSAGVILEAFRPGTEPSREMAGSPFIFGQNSQMASDTLGDLEALFADEGLIAANSEPAQGGPGFETEGPGAPPPPTAARQDDALGGLY